MEFTVIHNVPSNQMMFIIGEIEMVYKDQEKRREYHRQWKKEHPGYNRKWWRSWKKKKDPNYKPRITFHDYETHRELAMNSGIQSKREWKECYKMGLFPDGIYQDPAKHNAFGAK